MFLFADIVIRSPMYYILAIGTFEAVFLTVLLLAKKNKSRSDFFLGLIFFFYALSIGSTFIEVYNFNHHFPFPALMNLSWLILFLHGPALWLYIKSLSKPAFRFKAVHLIHFMPFLVFLVIQYVSFIQLPEDEKILLVEQNLFKEHVFYKISVLAIGVSTISYLLWALLLIRHFRTKLKQQYSQIERLDLSWLKTLIIAALICYGINILLFNLDLIFHFASYQFLMAITYSFASVYILVLGFYGLKQPDVFLNNTLALEKTVDKLVESEKPQVKANETEFVADLVATMNSKKPYLDPELTLESLGKIMKVRPEFLSGMLNTQLKQNFFDFVNRYRVEEFKKECVSIENKHLSVMGIAHNCGFNSKAAFYRAFKKFEGITPTAYIEKVSL